MIRPHRVAAAIAGIAMFCAPSAVVAAPKAKSFQQEACASAGAPCAVLTGQLYKKVIRSFEFLSKVRGTAPYHFTGSLYCVNDADGPRAIDLDAQIVTATGGPPASRSEPSGKRIAGLIPGKQPAVYSTTFDLAATRSVTTSGDSIYGPSFMLHGYLAQGVTCYVYGANFTIDYFPQ